MTKIFTASHKDSDQIAFHKIPKEDRLFVTVNGQHVGFIHHDDVTRMGEAFDKHLPKKKEVKVKEPAKTPDK